MSGQYFASLADLHENGGRITVIDEDPERIGIASDSVRVCWECSDEIVLVVDDHYEAVIQYRHHRGHGTNWARFCSHDCWSKWATVEG